MPYRAGAMPGWIYVIRYGFYPYKIGRAVNLTRRLREYSSQIKGYALLHAVKTDDCYQLEKYLHAYFGNRRRRRNKEYFDLTEDDIVVIHSLSAEATFLAISGYLASLRATEDNA